MNISNELRLGNWVLNLYDSPVQVTVVDDTVTWAKPIRLTPEILERCGFNSVSRNEDGSYNFWSKELDASIDYEDENLFRYRVHERQRTRNIVSVHDLQNLHFALKKVEIECVW